jgi:hypothetical protein
MDAPGSFRERSKALRVLAAIRNEELDNIEAQIAIEEVLLPRLETTDDSDLEEALDKLSAEDFDDLLPQILAASVPTESAEN